ncbi:MAG: redoxin family protein [Planctomycetes bacterium]|nr:redoxin family protein [Planctomycetota bacterium]
MIDARLAALAALALVCLSPVRAPVRAQEARPPAPGAAVERLELVDVRYRVRRGLDELVGDRRALVLAFTTLDCPLANRYLPRLAALEAEYAPRGVRVALVNAGPHDAMTAIAARALEAGVDLPLLKDHDAAAARALGVGSTPEVVVLDAARRLAYRGRIDDRLRVTGERPAPAREDLREALEDVLAGRPVRVAETAVDGCRLAGPAPAPSSPPGFAQVLPILERRCQGCHRPGGQAPFSLLTHDDAWALAETIAEVVRDERMPPWSAAPGVGALDHVRALTLEERRTLLAWVAAGAPEGDAPATPTTAAPPPDTGWLIDPPDLVISMAAEVELPAEGLVPYRYELLPHTFEADTWIAEAQLRPSNPRVMHHCNLAYLLPDDGYQRPHFITGQVPGGQPMRLEPGLGLKVPAGAVLVLQIHYVTTGRPERDRISLGLRWPRAPVRKQARHLRLEEPRLEVPPGAPAHRVRVSRTLPADATGLALFMHMHLRGRDATFLAHRPDGVTEPLLVLPAYAFDWQQTYFLSKGAVRLPRGTRIECVAHYDNSAWNPFNPDPGATVRYGPQTHDEMFFGFFFYTDDAEDLDVRVDPRTGTARRWH